MGLDEPDRATDCGDDGKFHKSRYQFRAFAIPRHYSRVDFRKHSVAGPAIAGLLTDFPPAIWAVPHRSEEHTSELQSLMRISYAVFCLKKKKQKTSISP